MAKVIKIKEDEYEEDLPLLETADDLLTEEDTETDETEVRLPSGKGKVVVRSLTREEMYKVKGKKLSMAQMEQVLLSWACVVPKMTRAQVKIWQSRPRSAGDIEEVTRTISRISGMTMRIDKSEGNDLLDVPGEFDEGE